jgi:hypothetical protein
MLCSSAFLLNILFLSCFEHTTVSTIKCKYKSIYYIIAIEWDKGTLEICELKVTQTRSTILFPEKGYRPRTFHACQKVVIVKLWIRPKVSCKITNCRVVIIRIIEFLMIL